MPGPEPAAGPASFPPSRPAIKSHHSTSLPSTPHHYPVDRLAPPRSPPVARNGSPPSPRSHHSTSLPPPRRVTGGCKYETGMANAKRRVPYSLGPDKLDADPEPPKALLTPAEDERLTVDMMALYDQLLPSQESENRRRRLVEKLAMILQQRWPDHDITVNVFGSTGNKLGTTDSDVDICITTGCRELEQVCVLADFLANQGMQRVVCISAAKVPIVKIWDPDLRLACDLNVNNPVALENTDMIRTYVEIDRRVRPLAMIIKHWTKRRVLNEAALGGTLSSYTWICMIINFLQTRRPPVLPALQQSPSLDRRVLSGLNVAFDRNIAGYADYGSENKESLGTLLFQFFRYYAHEIAFETSVMSVRAGEVITKAEKHWHLLQDNRLCVEEPFNTSRNLGNTADDTSVRGIHLELRRAFKMVSAAQLARCCDEYEAPSSLVEEPRPFERHGVSGTRPMLAHPTGTAGRNTRPGGRSNRQIQQLPRLSNTARRASSASTRGHGCPQPVPLSANPTHAEMSLQAQQRQYLLHDQLYLQYQYLQAQEQELRAQLHQQALSQSRVVPMSPYAQVAPPHGALPSVQEELMRVRAGRTNQPPLTAPIRPQGFSFSNHYGGRTPTDGSTTNPPSPLLHTVAPESRRSYRRSSMTHPSTTGSLRAHSQPPRPVPSPLSFPTAADRQRGHVPKAPRHASEDAISSSASFQDFADAVARGQRHFYPSSQSDRTASEYMGYYLGHSPPLPMYSRSVVGTPLTNVSGLGIQSGGISPQMLSQVPCNPLSMPPLASEPTRSSRAESEATRSEQEDNQSSRLGGNRRGSRSRSSSGPVVVNGSVKRGSERHQNLVDLYGSLNTAYFDASASDDIAVETPISSDGHSFDVNETHKTTSGSNAPALRSDQVIMPNVSKKHRGSNKPSRPVAGVVEGSLPRAVSRFPDEILAAGNPPAPETNGSCDLTGVLSSGGAVNVEQQRRTGAPRLSPVTETGMSSLIQQRQPIHEKSTHMAPKAKGKSKAKVKKPLPSPTNHNGRRHEALALQPNGLAFPPPTVPENPVNGKGSISGWQTQKKKSKHKKGSKSETDVKGMNMVDGDFLPVHESMRKGG